MSLKETKQVRNNKFFSRWDLIVYAVLLLAVVLSVSLLLVYTSEPSRIDYLEIRSDGDRIAVYDFESRALQAETGKESLFSTETQGDETRIFIYTAEGGFNLLTVDNAERTADMSDADCSAGKDCTLMHIRRAGQTIVCVPHGLVIEGKTVSEDAGGEIVIG